MDRGCWGRVQLWGGVVVAEVWTVTAESWAALTRDVGEATVAWQWWIGWASVREIKYIALCCIELMFIGFILFIDHQFSQNLLVW